MPNALIGKVALVTGGSRGIGAVVRRLASDGATVAFSYAASEGRAKALVAEIEKAGGTTLAIRADSADADANRGGLAAWQRKRVIDFVDEHFAEDNSLEALAELVRLSPNHFLGSFKQSFGEPPHGYLRGRRIERAKALRANPRLSVTEVAPEVGFSTPSAFEYDTPSPPDLLHTPDLGRWEPHCFNSCKNRRFTERNRLGRPGFVKSHDARVPFKYSAALPVASKPPIFSSTVCHLPQYGPAPPFPAADDQQQGELPPISRLSQA